MAPIIIDKYTDKARMINRKLLNMSAHTLNRCIYGCVCVNDFDSS